jgi:hypothetical protein
MVVSFNPAAGTYPIFAENRVRTLKGFTLYIKNHASAGAGNQIEASTSDNYAIDLYFAEADLGVAPGANKSEAFPATLTSGDMTVGLAVGASTNPAQVFTASGVTIRSADCNKYTWICACVKNGSGAQYIDSVTTNNCDCLDATDKISCPAG